VRNKQAIDRSLNQLFDAERAVRRLHDELAEQPENELLEGLLEALPPALQHADEDEAALRLVRIASLLGELSGPRVVDALIDVMGSEHPEPRRAAGEELEELAYDRFKEVAAGIERALKRLPVGSPALPELPYLLAEIPEPGAVKLVGQFLSHPDADAVAAAIEALVEMGDPATMKLMQPLMGDQRTVELADDGGETMSEVTIGELAAEAVEMLSDISGGEDDGAAGAAARGGAS
jgi:HEAT repeat protein